MTSKATTARTLVSHSSAEEAIASALSLGNVAYYRPARQQYLTCTKSYVDGLIAWGIPVVILSLLSK